MPPPAPAEEAGLTRERVFDAVKAVAAVSLALFSLYSAIFGVFQDMVQKGTHLGACAVGNVAGRNTPPCVALNRNLRVTSHFRALPHAKTD